MVLLSKIFGLVEITKYLSPKGFKVDSIQDSDCEFDKDEFILLLEYFPNIQDLQIWSSSYANKYFQYIIDTKSNKCLNQVQVISSIPDFCESYQSSESDNMHFSICYKHRATITSLEVNYKHIIMNLGSRLDKTLTFLSHFIRLTHLTLNNTCDNNLTTFDIQKACPHLISLEYTSSCGIPGDVVKKFLNDPSNRNLNRSLKRLELTMPKIPANYARYITDYITPQVDSLKLSIYGVNLYEWIDDIGMDNALKLANQLRTVKNTSFSCTADKQYGRKSTSYKSRMTIFFELLNAFKGDNNTVCYAKYSDLGSSSHAMQYNLKDGLRLNYGLKYADYYRRNEVNAEQDDYIDQEYRLPVMVEILLPDITISMIGPEVINHFYIRISDSNNPELTFRFLEYALIHCPKLELFDFKFIRRRRQEIHISADLARHRTRGNNHILSESTQENLKVIKTAEFIPSKELLNLISSYLPNIEFFACGGPGHGTTQEMTEIDFTAFKNLNTFYFDIKIMSGLEADYAFIHLKYSDGDEAYYCRSEKDFLALNYATLEFLQECNNNQELVTRSITIKCNKDVKFVVCVNEYSIIAEFDNGNLLDRISINSNFLRNVFL